MNSEYAKRRQRKYIKSKVGFAITAVVQLNQVRFIHKHKENTIAPTRDGKADSSDWRLT